MAPANLHQVMKLIRGKANGQAYTRLQENSILDCAGEMARLHPDGPQSDDERILQEEAFGLRQADVGDDVMTAFHFGDQTFAEHLRTAEED